MSSNPVVIDAGSFFTCCGGAGEDVPSSVFPTVGLKTESDYLIGDSAVSDLSESTCSLEQIIGRNPSGNWEGYLKLLQKCLSSVKAVEGETPILLIEPLLTPKAVREEITRMAFEDLNVPGLYIANSAVCSLYATAKTSGFIVECSHSGSTCAAVHEGNVHPHTTERTPLGGDFMTNLLTACLDIRSKEPDLSRQKISEYLSSRSYPQENELRQMQSNLQKRALAGNQNDTNSNELPDPVEVLKQKALHFKFPDVFDPKKILNEITSKNPERTESISLPDGTSLAVRDESWLIPEMLFAPEYFNIKKTGLAHGIVNSMSKIEQNLLPEICQNIIVSGGVSEIPGFSNRLHRELCNVLPESLELKVLMSPSLASTRSTRRGKSLASWTGASVLSSQSTFQQLWLVKAEYEESGPTVINRKTL